MEGDLCPQLPGFSSHCVDVESLGGLDHTEAAVTSAILHNLFEMFPKAVIPGITFRHQGRE